MEKQHSTTQCMVWLIWPLRGKWQFSSRAIYTFNGWNSLQTEKEDVIYHTSSFLPAPTPLQEHTPCLYEVRHTLANAWQCTQKHTHKSTYIHKHTHSLSHLHNWHKMGQRDTISREELAGETEKRQQVLLQHPRRCLTLWAPTAGGAASRQRQAGWDASLSLSLSYPAMESDFHLGT